MTALRSLAFEIVDNPSHFIFEDTIDAYQYICDNGLHEILNQDQKRTYQNMIESGVIDTVKAMLLI